MGNSLVSQTNDAPVLRVAANQDQFGEHRGLGVSAITFKVTPKDNNGIFIIENTFHEKGGPANTCTTTKMNGFMLLKANSFSKSVRSGSG